MYMPKSFQIGKRYYSYCYFFCSITVTFRFLLIHSFLILSLFFQLHMNHRIRILALSFSTFLLLNIQLHTALTANIQKRLSNQSVTCQLHSNQLSYVCVVHLVLILVTISNKNLFLFHNCSQSTKAYIIVALTNSSVGLFDGLTLHSIYVVVVLLIQTHLIQNALKMHGCFFCYQKKKKRMHGFFLLFIYFFLLKGVYGLFLFHMFFYF